MNKIDGHGWRPIDGIHFSSTPKDSSFSTRLTKHDSDSKKLLKITVEENWFKTNICGKKEKVPTGNVYAFTIKSNL